MRHIFSRLMRESYVINIHNAVVEVLTLTATVSESRRGRYQDPCCDNLTFLYMA